MIQIIRCQVREWGMPHISGKYFHLEAMHKRRGVKRGERERSEEGGDTAQNCIPTKGHFIAMVPKPF